MSGGIRSLWLNEGGAEVAVLIEAEDVSPEEVGVSVTPTQIKVRLSDSEFRVPLRMRIDVESAKARLQNGTLEIKADAAPEPAAEVRING